MDAHLALHILMIHHLGDGGEGGGGPGSSVAESSGHRESVSHLRHGIRQPGNT